MTTPDIPGVDLRHADVRNTVVTHCPAGHPQVVQCHPLRGSTSDKVIPFPTLYWLVCPALIDAVSRMEHGGWIERLQQRLGSPSHGAEIEEAKDPGFIAAVSADHDAYIEARWALLSDAERERIRDAGLESTFTERGIGGIRNRRSIKCLHLHYAHHLAAGSTIGDIVARSGEADPCAAALPR